MMFKPLDGDSAVLYERGVYKQVDLATRNGFLFAKVGGGYVRLYADGSTSKDRMKLDAISTEMPLCRDRLNRLCAPEMEGATPLESTERLALTDGR